MEAIEPVQSVAINAKLAEGFLNCAVCNSSWPDQKSLLTDPEISVIGYQTNFIDLKFGLFLFNHSCGTTLSMQVRHFQNLYHGPIASKRATGTEDCPKYCLYKDDMRPCSVDCECAYVREILQIIQKWPKTVTLSG
jgi:hypothetical protein